MASHALVTFVAIALAIVLFSLPLVLKYHVYRPESKDLVAGDIAPVKGRLSSVWCQGVDLDSSSNFKAFSYDSEPEVDESNVERTNSMHHIVLTNKAQEYWGFHLLRGSHVKVATCARLITADVTVVKGYAGLEQCLLEHRIKRHKEEFSDEDSQSESESDEDTSSISSSQGVITNETDSPYICSNSLKHVELPTSYKCKHPFHRVAIKHTLSQDIEESDYYYYIFSSRTYLDIIPNEFSIHFTIDRTHYNYSTSSGNCSTGKHCHLVIPLAVEQKIVVQIEASNGTLQANMLQMACKPREWLFLVFFAMFLIVIFLCAFQ